MTVEERSTGSLDLSAGWVQDTGLVLSAAVAQDNLFGTGKSVAARVSRGKVTQNVSLSFTDPDFTPDGVSLGYNVYGNVYNPHNSSSSPKNYKTTRIGGGVNMGVPVTEYDRVNFGLGVEHLNVKLFDRPPKRY